VRFFQATYRYLETKVPEGYGREKLAREIDLEWQTMKTEVRLSESCVQEVSREVQQLGYGSENKGHLFLAISDELAAMTA
jgi:hypothetical protein